MTAGLADVLVTWVLCVIVLAATLVESFQALRVLLRHAQPEPSWPTLIRLTFAIGVVMVAVTTTPLTL